MHILVGRPAPATIGVEMVRREKWLGDCERD